MDAPAQDWSGSPEASASHEVKKKTDARNNSVRGKQGDGASKLASGATSLCSSTAGAQLRVDIAFVMRNTDDVSDTLVPVFNPWEA